MKSWKMHSCTRSSCVSTPAVLGGSSKATCSFCTGQPGQILPARNERSVYACARPDHLLLYSAKRPELDCRTSLGEGHTTEKPSIWQPCSNPRPAGTAHMRSASQ